MVMSHSAYAELAVIDAKHATRVPEGLELTHAAALPVVTQTGEQLVRNGVKIQAGQTVLITGALGNVGRSAVWAAKRVGARVLAGVRTSQIRAAEQLGVDGVVAVDDDKSMEMLGLIDAVADTVGGEVAARLLAKVRPEGTFASVVGPPANGNLHPTIHITAIRVLPDAESLKIAAEEAASGKLVIPIDRMVPLEDASEAHTAAQKGGTGKILLLA